MRRGAATLAFRAKISADKIQLLGDWHSDAYKRYLAFSLQDKIQVSKTLREYIVKKPSVKFCGTRKVWCLNCIFQWEKIKQSLRSSYQFFRCIRD